MRLPKVKINLAFLLVLLGIFLLRVPSFFEPYWYGDEGIYLALGQMMNRGAVLYRDIWDNKPPLLYALYAVHPTLLWAKISATVFVLGTCILIYFLAKRLLGEQKTNFFAFLATAICGIFLSIPLFEGTIANAELYFTLPIVAGALLIYNSLDKTPRILTSFWIGLLASAAFLFKVPAMFDFAGMVLAWLVVEFVQSKNIKRLISFVTPLGLAFLAPLILVAGYFIFNRALSDFLVAAFSQNASYVAVDSGPLSKLSNPLFVKGTVLLLGSIFLIIGYLRKRVTRNFLFLALWFSFSLYGALLSNRPYMHYLLQIVPPATLLGAYLFLDLRKNLVYVIGLVLISIYLAKTFTGAFFLDNLGYYKNFWEYISERKSWEGYVNGFDPRTINSYTIANFISRNTSPSDPVFVWGDASFVYVLSGRPPVAKFIQAHHLSTIDPNNYDLIINRIKKYQPKYILISRPVSFQFPALEMLVFESYHPVGSFGNMYIYQNIQRVTPPTWHPGPN